MRMVCVGQFCPTSESAILGHVLRQPSGEPWNFTEAGQHLFGDRHAKADGEAAGPAPLAGDDVTKADEFANVAPDGARAHAHDVRQRRLAGGRRGAGAAAGAEDLQERLRLWRQAMIPRRRGRHVSGILHGRARLRPEPAGRQCSRQAHIDAGAEGGFAFKPHNLVGEHCRSGPNGG